MQVFMYIVSLVFQLTGGLILLVNNIKLSPKKLGEEYCAGNIEIKLDKKTEKIIVDSNRLEGLLINVFLNRVAFISLSAGYVLSVFGNIGNFSTELAALIIFTTSIILSIISYGICSKWSKSAASKEKYKEMVRNNVPNDTMTAEED